MSALPDLIFLVEVTHRIDPQATLLRSWPLTGGVSAEVTAFEIALPGGESRTLVLRQHGTVDRAQNPYVAAHEFRLLQLLHEVQLPAPLPVHLDQTGAIFPTPFIVVEYVEGQTISGPDEMDEDCLRQMTAYLARLHSIEAMNADVSFLRKVEDGVTARLSNPPSKLDDTMREGLIRDRLAAAWPLPQRYRPVLLHGDFWPGNILWRDGTIAAVVDWEDAAVGDPLAEIANARLEILWAFGVDAMQRFTDLYLSLSRVETEHLPYWDLYAALRPIAGIASWGLEAKALRDMREQHRWFSAQALDALGSISR